MEQFQSRWQKKFVIRSYHADVNQKATIPALCDYFQEVAWEHAEHLDFGFEHLKTVGKFWVLSRLQMEVYNYPVWGDEITVTTWPRGLDGMFALREFLVISASGSKLAAATTSWLVLDAEKHRPQRISPEDFSKFMILTDSALGITAEKIAKPESPIAEESFKAKFSDIDVNRHVNNVKYIEWAIDSFPNDILMSREIGSFSVNFTGEASLGDAITLWKQTNANNEFQVILTDDTKEKELCRIKAVIK
ncbi:MAG TPA: acyl-ACP thioesterase domain-containing protein [Bacteroidales bacterium]